MHHWIMAGAISTMLIGLRGRPPQPHATIFSMVFGSGLASVLLVLVTLILLALIIVVAWMFISGRWITLARASAILPSSRTSPYTGSVSSNYRPLPPGQLPMVEMNHPAVSLAASSSPFPGRTEAGRDQLMIPPVPSETEPLDNKPWLNLVERCVALFDELDGLFPAGDPRQETANHVMYRLREILALSGVEVIDRDTIYDVHRHRLETPDTGIAPGAPIVRIISPGFAIGTRVLRPARVRVAVLPMKERADNS